MDKPDIILLCGKKRSGKDTIAEYLVENYNFKHYKITQKLKDCVKVLFNIDDYQSKNSNLSKLEYYKQIIKPTAK